MSVVLELCNTLFDVFHRSGNIKNNVYTVQLNNNKKTCTSEGPGFDPQLGPDFSGLTMTQLM